jgi:flagellar motor switch protein FliM
MAEILTQNQIDELLNELAEEKTGLKQNTNKDKVKNYDFRSPKKISREQYKVLSSFTDVIARHITAYLSSLLRNYCEFSVASIEEHPYNEYNNSLPDTQITAIIDIYPINTSILFDISNTITFAIIERMLGGNINTNIIPDREFTEIEITVVERIFRRLCIFIQDALQNIPDCKVTLRQIDTNSRFIRAIRMEEIVEVVVYNVTIEDIKGTATACIPYAFVDTMANAASKDDEKSTFNNSSEEERMKYLSELRGTSVEIRGILGTAKLSLKDLSDLQVGDVIRLDQKNGDPILVTVNGNKWFWGEPGVKKYCKAIKINKYLTEGQN